jgi:hypothetical protein
VTFRDAWGLPATAKVIGGLGSVAIGGNTLGRNDAINLYNASGVLVDHLRFGDQTYPGTVRAQNFSGQAMCDIIGQNDIASWTLSAVGDAFGSVSSIAGDVGTPGRYSPPCVGPACDPDVNQDGNVDQDDVAYLINVISGGGNPGGIDPDFNQDGNVDQEDVIALVNVVAGGDCP